MCDVSANGVCSLSFIYARGRCPLLQALGVQAAEGINHDS